VKHNSIPQGGEGRQRPKPGASKPITAKPDHKREEISDDVRKKKCLTLGCKRVREKEIKILLRL
jgi:hypothetical protein